ncbi:uncharacterized protein IL334_002089 [Kwoniella shivajii]|uniref:Uncharacterized protein n=1 Tax=Kwoniella shivajii TaxID=564305 RepID=A0ABZ1CUW3_9TREE|nr:hypothetical protein IL334_002089 [Kwoniella shivajii]
MSNAGPSRRYDGRRSDEMRPLVISIGELDRADGSGRFGFGSTAALASCSGPLEVRLNKELPTKATLEISHRPLEGVGATPSRALITTLESIYPSVLKLSSHPRSLIQIIVQSLSSSSTSSTSSFNTYNTPSVYIDTDASEEGEPNTWPKPKNQSSFPLEEVSSPIASYTFASRSASINASTLAILSNGSIPMTSLPISISVACIDSTQGQQVKGDLIVDPTVEEESRAKSRFAFAWAFGKNISMIKKDDKDSDVDVKMELDQNDREDEMELIWVESEGKFNKETFSDALELSKIACRTILSEIREKLGQELESKTLQ